MPSNCLATVYKDSDTLSAGQRTGRSRAELLKTPGYFFSPLRDWQQRAVFEGRQGAELSVHTAVRLAEATAVQIANHPLAGEYRVQGARLAGKRWTLSLLRKRPGEL